MRETNDLALFIVNIVELLKFKKFVVKQPCEIISL